MPLQNRVTPFSTIEAVPSRGLFTGNRGILHNEHKQLVTTRWRTKAWIVCLLEFKNMRRPVMQPNRWTQLFFLDEATAFAAGHRPCAYCRRADYNLFLKLSGCPGAKDMDNALHPQRTTPQSLVSFHSLPSYSMFTIEDKAYLKLDNHSLIWTHDGYHAVANPGTNVQPLTPPLTRQVLSAGYKPLLHPTALIR